MSFLLFVVSYLLHYHTLFTLHIPHDNNTNIVNKYTLTIENDSVAEVLEFRRGDKILLCKGRRKEDGLPVLIKSFATRFPSSNDLERLRQEYEVFFNN